MRWLLALLPALALLAHAPQALAGAWTLPEGLGQTIVTSTFMSGDRMFTASGRLIPVREYSKFELTPFAEYGITDWLTAVVSTSILTAAVAGRPDDRYSGLGHTEIGARARFAESDWGAASVQASARLPGALDARDPAQMGNTEPEFDMRVLAGTGFPIGDWLGFVDAQLAYRWRGGALPDEYRLDLTAGVRPRPDWLWMLQSFNVVSAGRWPGVYRQARHHKLQASIVHDLDAKWSVQAGVLGTVAGRNALQERGGILAVWARF
jgi:protein XagA